MAQQDPINLAIEEGGPRSTDDLVAYWVRSFERWTSGAEQNAGPDEDNSAVESDPAA